jgi:hypothetical protein
VAALAAMHMDMLEDWWQHEVPIDEYLAILGLGHRHTS